MHIELLHIFSTYIAETGDGQPYDRLDPLSLSCLRSILADKHEIKVYIISISF